MNEHEDDNFTSDENVLTGDEIKKQMMEQNESLVKELEKTKAENEELKGKEEEPKELSTQEMMIIAAEDIAKNPISRGMREHAFSHQGTLTVNNLDPSKHHRYISKMDDKLKLLNGRNVAQAKQDGYVVTTDPEGKLAGPRMNNGSTVETHDLILMETSKENAVKLAMKPVIKAKAAITAVKTGAENQGLEGEIRGKKKKYANDLQMMDDSDTIKVDNIF